MLSSISFQSSMRFVRTTSSTPGSNRACRSVSAGRSSNDLLNQNFKAWDQCDRQRSCPSFLTCRTSGSQAGSTGRRLGVLLQPLFQQTLRASMESPRFAVGHSHPACFRSLTLGHLHLFHNPPHRKFSKGKSIHAKSCRHHCNYAKRRLKTHSLFS